MYQSKPSPYDPGVAKDLADSAGNSVSGDIEILRVQTGKQIPHSPSYDICFKSLSAKPTYDFVGVYIDQSRIDVMIFRGIHFRFLDWFSLRRGAVAYKQILTSRFYKLKCSLL